jgi:hypothetical protein
MRASLARWLPLATLAAALSWIPQAAGAEPGQKITVLFTGDNGGELAPCG